MSERFVWVFSQQVGCDGESEVVGVVESETEATLVLAATPVLECRKMELGKVLFLRDWPIRGRGDDTPYEVLWPAPSE